MKASATTRALRPLGFFLYGLLWLVLTLAIVVLAWLMALVPIFDFHSNQGAWANPWSLIFWIPAFTLVMVIGPWCMFSQSMLGFVFAGQSLSKTHQNRPLTRLVGSDRGRYFAAIIDTPATRLWTEVGNIGFSPGWRFATASLVLVSGVCLARFVDSPVAAVAGWALLVAGASVSLWSILPRLKDPAPLAFPTHSTDPAAKAKHLKGVANREAKRARDLTKVREAGQTPVAKDGPQPTAFERWGVAEADIALRHHSPAKRDARLGVPGALNGANDEVTSAMNLHVTREEAVQFVIDARAYRGKKPVPVKLQPGEQYPPAAR